MISTKPNFSLTEGTEFILNNERFQIAMIKGLQVVLESETQVLTFSQAQIVTQYRQGLITPAPPKTKSISLVLNLSPEDRETMHFREEVVLQMLKESPNAPTAKRNILCAYDEIQKRSRGKKISFPHHGTAARWLKRYRDANNDKYALIDNYQQTQGRGAGLPLEVKEVVSDFIHKYYLERRLSPNKAFEFLKSKMPSILPGFKCPSKSVFYECVNEIDADYVTFHREGPYARNQAQRQALKKYELYYPFSRWEMDGVVAQIGLLCPVTFKFLGIATIMFAFDCYTKVVPGYAVLISKKKAENSELAVSCFKNAVLPNEDGSGFFGLPLVLSADAGTAFTSTPFTHFMAMTDVNRVTTVVRKPEKRPFIERFNLTFRRGCLEDLPGYGGVLKLNEKFYIEDNVEKAATLTVDEFMIKLDQFITHYNEEAHSSLLDRSPKSVWEHHISDNPGLVRLPGDDVSGNSPYEAQSKLKLFEHFSGRCIKATLQGHKGIVVEKRYYNSVELRETFKYLNKEKKALTVYFDHIDISTVVVVSPTSNNFVIVPITDGRVQQPMSKSQYDAIVEAPFSDIPKASTTPWDAKCHIVDGAMARRKAQELAKVKENREKNKKRREKELEYEGIDLGNGPQLHAAISDLKSENAALPITIDVDQPESEKVNDLSDVLLPKHAAKGGSRGEF
ncbi:hypothetical protein [Salinimonas iocasae]|uniref:Integrase catalytic domain-containing protein n=1 Tax=Salinimonas iocasae TaxID=2572577 RepID=A0A5B7YFG2_9ALTE|nr:hypothetical protein [Salinimonas iocasae]QCZ94381.1 hypothetical protein FBQ74_13285 [Salinimonas iocasae]